MRRYWVSEPQLKVLTALHAIRALVEYDPIGLPRRLLTKPIDDILEEIRVGQLLADDENEA